jgi:hypothetical protein
LVAMMCACREENESVPNMPAARFADSAYISSVQDECFDCRDKSAAHELRNGIARQRT